MDGLQKNSERYFLLYRITGRWGGERRRRQFEVRISKFVMGIEDMVQPDRNFPGVDPAAESEVLAVAREVARIARRVLRDRQYRVFLYGSWVSGGARPRSDIDIGIAGPEPVDPSAMQQIREASDVLPTLYSVEIVDFARAPATFRAEATARTLELEPA